VFAVVGDSLFVSTDRGAAFTKVGGPLEKERIRALAAASDGMVFVGSFRGILASRDAGSTWATLTGTLPNTDVRAIAIGGSPESRLWIGLAGGSVWSAPLPKR
jgi:ligand-binding sensor domain-containing protein